jgi:putative transposase
MPRIPRPILVGQPLHVLQRGNNRGVTFVEPRDFAFYRQLLRQYSEKTGCQIHGYVMMTNHVHLLLTPAREDSAARLMQSIGRHYVRYFNDRQSRTGTLWEGRFKSMIIDSERYFLTCSRYVDLNPVRAGMTNDAATYLWSSHRYYAFGFEDPVVTPHALYWELGTHPPERQEAYRALCGIPLESRSVESIRKATKSNGVLGRTMWRKEVQALLKRRVEQSKHGGDRRSAGFRSEEVPASS